MTLYVFTRTRTRTRSVKLRFLINKRLGLVCNYVYKAKGCASVIIIVLYNIYVLEEYSRGLVNKRIYTSIYP